MLAAMAEGDLIIEHPNREMPAAQATRTLVVGLLALSIVVIAVATAGGWAKLQGMKPVQIAFALIYVVLAVQIARWRGGLLPVAGTLAVVLLILCAISGPQWFARDAPGYTEPLLAAGIVGALTIALVPLQILLVLAAARGTTQHWNVEGQRPAANSSSASAAN
jgi:hypothetical protein